MENNWKNYRFSDVIDLIGGGTPKTSESSYWNGDIPWLSVVDFNTGRKYVSDTEKKITEQGLNNSSTKLLNEGDIIISARGTVGALAVLDKTMAFNQSCYGVKAKEDFSSNDYIFYLLKDTVNNLKQFAHGGVFDTITKDTFKEIEIQLPPLPEQKAIASVLSSLDDKIDLLHQQNQTLEALAETLLRQWFEEKDFDSTIADLVDIQNGYAFKSKDFSEVGLNKVIKIKNISGSTVDISNADRISESVADNVNAKFSIVGGDILFAMTGAEIGKMGIVERNSQNLWLNQRVGLFKEKYEGSKYLAYLCLKSDFGQDYIENTATGSAQPNISGTGIEKCPFPKLTTEQIEHYSQILIPQFDKIVSNLGNIKTLTQLRDTLLPKLMSGEVRVKL